MHNPAAKPAATPRAWHAYLWAPYALLALHASNAAEARFTETLGPIALALTLTAVLDLIARIDVSEPTRRGLLVGATSSILFGFGYLQRALYRLLVGTPLGPRLDTWLAPILIAALLCALYLLYRRTRRGETLPTLTRVLNVAAIVLIALPLASIALSKARDVAPPERNAHRPQATEPDRWVSDPPDGPRPNIYVLMLDAYGGEDVLRDHYGFDNRPFLDGLRERGFHVSDTAHSNYPYTQLSLTSLLNMRYILEPEEIPRSKTVEWDQRDGGIIRHFRSNRVTSILKSLGYRIVTFETEFQWTAIDGVDDHLSVASALTEYQTVALQQTLPAAILNQLGISIDRYLNDDTRRKRVRFTLKQLPNIAELGEPVMVFAHITCPHVPFLFNADGTPYHDPRTLTPETFRAGYVPQLEFLNPQILKTIDALLARDPTAAIVVQGDHGPRYYGAAGYYERDAYAREWLSTLNAIHIPDQRGYENLSSDFSQVNTFRFLFNQLFDASYDLLPDMSYLLAPDSSSLYLPLTWEGTNPQFPQPTGAENF